MIMSELGIDQRHEEDMRILCRPKQLEIETYWNKLREVYDSYLEQHNPIMGHYQALREKDDFYQRDIARNDFKILQATEMLMNLQKGWIKNTNTMSYKLKRMNSHKEELAKKYWLMKKESKTQKEQGDEMLAVLVDASHDAIKRLEDVQDKLHKITQMAQICSKYEHENDEMFLEGIEDADLNLDFENLDGAMVEECKEFSKMDKFLLKVNRVRVQTMCLRVEKAKLAKENIQLKQYIKRYLTDLALKGGKDRPLSVRIQSEVNNIDAGKINRPVTCIEGALSNAVMHEKRVKVEAKKIKEMGGVCAYPRVYC